MRSATADSCFAGAVSSAIESSIVDELRPNRAERNDVGKPEDLLAAIGSPIGSKNPGRSWPLKCHLSDRSNAFQYPDSGRGGAGAGRYLPPEMGSLHISLVRVDAPRHIGVQRRRVP